MDYDDDGILDLVSGSYDPGDVYWMRGLGEGKFAAVEVLRDENGTELVHHPRELEKFHAMEKDPKADPTESIQARVASFGSWVTLVDFEGDGDLDAVIGSFGGDLFLRRNVGTRAEPVYCGESEALEGLHVNAHAAPVAADWDEDGLFDLVVGASDGSVGWFRNEGTKTEPRFGDYRTLVPAASAHKFLTEYVLAGESTGPGTRAQIDVVDYDQDGHLDLLVGDYRDVITLRDPGVAERAKVEAAIGRAKELLTRLIDAPDRDAAGAEFESVRKELEPYVEKESRSSYVWLYLRKAASDGSGTRTPD